MTEEFIFQAALEKQNPEEQAAYLEQACAGDAPLRQRVEALLKAHAAAGRFLEEPAPELEIKDLNERATAEQVAEAATLGLDETPPTNRSSGARVRYFGDYELLEEIA